MQRVLYDQKVDKQGRKTARNARIADCTVKLQPILTDE